MSKFFFLPALMGVTTIRWRVYAMAGKMEDIGREAQSFLSKGHYLKK